ncbi:unnamed protein product [Plutella xylostella]|uniref:separase n=1 Tax=Plutella xylostella TaxID=51655 RepID=A0A8S4DL02_PLUXY|nr:unnamed protein product [Plutella xylostella]
MEDFDIFTNEINYTKPLYTNILNKFVKEVPVAPFSANYESARKLQAEECLKDNDDLTCAFHLSEAVSSSVRTLAAYRDEQIKIGNDKLHMIKSHIKPVQEILKMNTGTQNETELLDLPIDLDKITKILKKYEISDDEPLHKTYLKFTPENNVDDFQKILKELPKEWTIVQLTTPYNPNENLKPLNDYRTEIDSIYITVLTNDYLDDSVGPFTVVVPANVVKEGEKPLFTELYSLLEDNYKTIENAQLLNNKRLVRNYWSRREDIDLRMKSVINTMDRAWLGGWGCLLTGRLQDPKWRDRVREIVDSTITDWGFIRLTKKQRVLLYNLIESSPQLSSTQIKTCLRKILTENGNPDDVREVLDTSDCIHCTVEFNLLTELCVKCLANSFKSIHHFSLVDGIKAFSQAATLVGQSDEWADLKKAKRHPVILIVDEMLDTFPWECLPLLNTHPVSRMENLHFIYYLYKVHEKNIVDGYYLSKADEGRYVINPEKNLSRMERRMVSFVQYWCPQWSGTVGEPAAPEDSDFFLYCGHGDGGQLSAPAPPAPAPPALLAGCGSCRVARRAPRAPPAVSAHHYHIATSPIVIGMLWEVTDLEVDKVVTSLLSLCVPSTAPVPWDQVGKARWGDGQLDTNVEKKSDFKPEPLLLSAVARARRSTSYVMIASSVVARGIPVRVVEGTGGS